MSKEQPLLRWGILSTASIARKNWQAIRHSGNGIVTAVASRDLDRCRRFIAECQGQVPFPEAPKAFRSYDEIIDAKDIDAVYIPLPTALRKEWVLRAAASGKHVMCEKPCAPSLPDLREMLDACRRHRVQFMDGVMFMHNQRLQRVRAVLDDGETIGQLRRISSAFTFDGSADFFASNVRAHGGLEPHGCLGDQGWYNIRIALWAANGQLPRRVTGRLLSEYQHAAAAAPVPTEFSGEMFFDGGVTSDFYCGFIAGWQQWAVIVGARGSLRVPDFVVPNFGCETVFDTFQPEFKFDGCFCNMEPNARRWTIPEYSNSHPTAQETNLFRNFAAQVLSGKVDESWPEITFKTQQVMEACLESARNGGREVELKA